jgi:cytochrome c oxidase subunit 2
VRRHHILQLVLIGVIVTAIGIPVALAIPWFPKEASSQAANVHTLYDVLLIASVPIFVLVETVVLYSVWKFRMRPGDEEKDGPPIHGNTRLEVVWTALPAMLIIGLVTFAYTKLHSNEKAKSGEMTINVSERQFAFEFSYPQPNGQSIVSSQLYLAKDQPVVFKLRSLDVIHSFFVPEFSQKLDAVPGITTTLRVTPTRIGTYPAECTELCGAGHSLMRATVRVVSPQDFRSWLSSQRPNGPPPIGTPPPSAAQPGIPGAASSATTTTPGTTTPSVSGAAAGKVVFTQTASPTCSTCHTLAAAGATGTVGPNLDQRLRTDCASPASKRIRGATLQQCIMTAITKPYAFLPDGYPSGVMPSNFAQTLTQAQIQSLVTFLASVAK